MVAGVLNAKPVQYGSQPFAEGEPISALSTVILNKLTDELVFIPKLFKEMSSGSFFFVRN